jgi:predicted neutral ceramidase superfamily lipid hydrolase
MSSWREEFEEDLLEYQREMSELRRQYDAELLLDADNCYEGEDEEDCEDE